MKKTGFVFLAVVLAFFWTGCQSSVKAALRTQKDPIALVSVVSNQDISWKQDPNFKHENLANTTNSPGLFQKKALQKDSDMTIATSADDLINTAEDIFRKNIEASGVIDLADKATVLNSGAYKNARINKFQASRDTLKPADYLFVDYKDKNFPPALASETGIQRSMFVEFNFTKAMATGVGKNGNFRANVDMTINILDAQGKVLYRTTFSLGSKDTMKVSNGVYSQSGLLDLFDSAITDVCYEFLDDLGS